MIKVPFDPTKLKGEQKEWWEAWSARAKEAVVDAIADAEAGRTHKFRQNVWRELKDWLLKNVFNGKCAYCECTISPGFYGDAEHYRPKGEVKIKETVTVVFKGKEKEKKKDRLVEGHPGYYWLAYHWKNLLPSCQKCNSGSGKSSQFPVGATHIANYRADRNDPDALDILEEPLLLHPYNDDPTQCLMFDDEGRIAARDDDPDFKARGEATIEICQLLRPELCSERKTAMTEGWVLYLNKISNRMPREVVLRWLKSKPFAGSVLEYARRRLAKELEALGPDKVE